jgi:transposase-like protein
MSVICLECLYPMAGNSRISHEVNEIPTGKLEISEYSCSNCGSKFFVRVEQISKSTKEHYTRNVVRKET